MTSPEEVESQLQADQQQQRNHPFSLLGRQSSIYSLTLDEFQHTLCESDKNFGSMNMDEFLTSIWAAGENQAIKDANTTQINHTQPSQSLGEAIADNGKAITRQQSLSRQVTLPEHLCRKTVDEFWSEIHNKGNRGQGQCSTGMSNDNLQNPETAQRQLTFGEMTLEDFLVKAGLVRGRCPLPRQQQQALYGMYQNSTATPAVGPRFFPRLTVAMAAGSSCGVCMAGVAPYSGAMVESSGFGDDGKGTNGYPARPRAAVGYGGRMGNGDGYGPGQGIGTPTPGSPLSSDGMCSQVDNQFGMDVGGLRVRKRIVDGPVEKVVERRRHRMIKNRESAARSRARKQVYTIELEAVLNQLKEENAHLRQTLAELEGKSNQQYFEELKNRAPTKAQKANEKLRTMRRNSSYPL